MPVRRINRPWPNRRAGKFDLIVADPPWNFKTWNPKKSTKKPPYGLMSLQDIKELEVWRFAADDCVLVMWATQAQLHHAIETMKWWGFDFKTSGAWAKQSKTGRKWAFGTGFILRSAAEFFIIGTRGHPKCQSRSIRNLMVAPVRAHSEKPEVLQDSLERMFPDARKCELFARRQRRGWYCCGDEL